MRNFQGIIFVRTRIYRWNFQISISVPLNMLMPQKFNLSLCFCCNSSAKVNIAPRKFIDFPLFLVSKLNSKAVVRGCGGKHPCLLLVAASVNFRIVNKYMASWI